MSAKKLTLFNFIIFLARPGLAQLVECLTHRYSESTSSNPGNLTSANSMWEQDWQQAGCQEVGMCSTRGGSRVMYIHYICLRNANKAEPTLALKPQRRHHQKFKNRDTSGPKKGHVCPPKA